MALQFTNSVSTEALETVRQKQQEERATAQATLALKYETAVQRQLDEMLACRKSLNKQLKNYDKVWAKVQEMNNSGETMMKIIDYLNQSNLTMFLQQVPEELHDFFTPETEENTN